MQLELLNEQGQAASKYDAPETVFGREYNEDLVHQIVVAFQANARQGTRAQKDRQQVNHSTKKPFKQKGTGRARAGMTSSPLWRGGGRIFPNSPDENFTQKINKKMYRAGMASIFSQLAREGRLAVVDSIKVDSPKTKQLAAKFKAMNLDSVLVIADEVDENLYLASRNLANVLVVEPRYADPLREGDARGRQDQRGHLQGAAGRHQARDQGRRRTDVQGGSQGRVGGQHQGQDQALRPLGGPPRQRSQGLRDAQAWPGAQ